MCCFFLVCCAICSRLLKKDKLKSQQTLSDLHIECVWMLLFDFRPFNSYLKISSPWHFKRVNPEDLKNVSSVLYSCKMLSAFLLLLFILFQWPFFTSLKAEIPKGGCVICLFESGTLICTGFKAVFYHHGTQAQVILWSVAILMN